MHLGKLLKSAGKKYRKINVKGICFDSRKAKKMTFFLQSEEIKLRAQNLFKMQSRREFLQ